MAEKDVNTYENHEKVIKLMYYSFTTLSTVGFGDMYPINDQERVMGAILMLLGNAIFSFIMTQFLDILSSWKKVDEDIGNGD